MSEGAKNPKTGKGKSKPYGSNPRRNSRIQVRGKRGIPRSLPRK